MEIYQKRWKYLLTMLLSALLLGVVFVTVRSSEFKRVTDPASDRVATSMVPAATEDSAGGDLESIGHGTGVRDTWTTPLFGSAAGHRVGVNDTWTTALVVADLDGDGDPDLVTGEMEGRIMAWRNDGTPFAEEWTGYQVGVVSDRWWLLALAAGDLDNDGDMDLATGYYHDHGPTIWENDGDPFGGEWSCWQVGSQKVGTLALADMDGDGRLDIVAGGGQPWSCSPSEDNRIMVWHAPEAPFSDAWQATDVGLAYYAVLGLDVGDLDNDGDNDIVIGTYRAPPVGDIDNPVPREQWPDVYQIRSFRNDGGDNWVEFNVGRDPEIETLGFQYHGYWGATVTSVKLADLDNDGDLDIAATERSEGDFLVMGWQNDGTPFSGELWAPTAVAVGERDNWLLDHVWWVESGDFDRDGDLDLVAGSGEQEPYQVMVWENSGVAFGTAIEDTAWERHNVGMLGEETRVGGVADFDRDGDLDLVAAAYVNQSSEIRLWENSAELDLALDVAPGDQAVAPGRAVTYTVVVTGLYGSDQPASLWVSGLPAGIEAAWSHSSLPPPGSSVLTLTLPLDSLPGEYTLLAVAIGEGVVRTTPFTLTVIERTNQIHLPVVLRIH